MDNTSINQALTQGDINVTQILSHLKQPKNTLIFNLDFGLTNLPLTPGILSIWAPRLYGKTFWLEQQIALTIEQFGDGTALYLKCDQIKDAKQLLEEIRVNLPLLKSDAAIKRLFIDGITAIIDWQKTIQHLNELGELKDILLVTTGSQLTDLREKGEHLPISKINTKNYILTPIAYTEFKQKCEKIFKSDTLFAYLLSGGSPMAANSLATMGTLPDYIVDIIKKGMIYECSARKRSRSKLIAVIQSLFKMACTPIGQAKLARESGLANNTVAQGYVELLSDLMVVLPSFAYDVDKKLTIYRKACKYQFVNVLAAISWHPEKPRTIEALKKVKNLSVLLEWMVAQEIWRQLCIQSNELMPEQLNFWQSKNHEIDFVVPQNNVFLEVKSGKTSPTEFIWFLKSMPQEKLLVVSGSQFETQRIQGITFEDFLLGSYV